MPLPSHSTLWNTSCLNPPFENFTRAYLLLQEAIITYQERELSSLEQEGVVQRFEYTLELAWKVLKDYLEFEYVLLERNTPRAVLRQAFEAKLINQGEVWQQALELRNLLSHTYNSTLIEEALATMAKDYMPAFAQLYATLNTLANEGDTHA